MKNKFIPIIIGALASMPAAGAFAQLLSNYAPAAVGLPSLGGGERNTFIALGLPVNLLAQLTVVGNDNTFTGFGTSGVIATGSRNSYFGSRAGQANTTGNENTFIGYQTGASTNGGQANTFLGSRAGVSATSASFNTFIGSQAGLNTTTGGSNFMMGTNAGINNTTGVGNFFLGDNTAGGNTTGGFNVYLGANAGNGTGVNGDNNTAIGFETGRTNVSGVNNTFIGFRADASSNGLSNATAIGNNAKVSASNSLILGSGVNVGIGTTAPQAKLEVTTGTSGVSGLRFTNLTSANTASGTTSKVLTVDASGNVILAGYSSGAREGAFESFWKKTDGGIQTVQSGGVVIGKELKSTPAGYQLYVADGILTERVKVAVKNSSEWSDYVFGTNYKLRSLAEVENFVKLNKHLPGVPSADQMVESGNDLHKTDAKLLEKIEELTLYSIELEKTTQKQQAEIDELKRLVKEVVNK